MLGGVTLASYQAPPLRYLYLFLNNKTAQLKVENLAQTTFGLSPTSFRAPHISVALLKVAKTNTLRPHVLICSVLSNANTV